MPVDRAWLDRAKEHQRHLTKPPGSLGRLEELAARLCAIQETLRPQAAPRRIVVFAADHGVAEEGVSPYPREVTAQMVANFRKGGAAINALARQAGADLRVVDAGVVGGEGVRDGTANFVRGPAMTEDDLRAALALGLAAAEEAARDGVLIVGLGEMGIGNTTAASAVTAALTGWPPARVTGRGTGADDATLARKVAVVERALAVNAPRADDPLDVLRKVGGLEIAALAGFCLGAAAARRAVVTDGFIATAAAFAALRLAPALGDYLFAAHRSTEPGHAALLEAAGLRPLLDLELRLGEGTGAALAMNLLSAAAAAHVEMATFDAAGVSDREPPRPTVTSRPGGTARRQGGEA